MTRRSLLLSGVLLGLCPVGGADVPPTVAFDQVPFETLASPIVMNLSITDPLQTTVPGSVITYHFNLMNTIGIDLPIFGFVNLNAPPYLTEIVDPFTVPANATVTGTLSFQVASTATAGLETFFTNAASTLHDPVSGDSYVSNFATLSVNVVPEPSDIIPCTIGSVCC